MTSIFTQLAGFGSSSRERVMIRRDADRLIRLWGTTAYDRATDLSAREDMGFIATHSPGHWWNVRSEIGRRTGHSEPAGAFVGRPSFAQTAVRFAASSTP